MGMRIIARLLGRTFVAPAARAVVCRVGLMARCAVGMGGVGLGGSEAVDQSGLMMLLSFVDSVRSLPSFDDEVAHRVLLCE